jgi:hypothetical protein
LILIRQRFKQHLFDPISARLVLNQCKHCRAIQQTGLSPILIEVSFYHRDTEFTEKTTGKAVKNLCKFAEKLCVLCVSVVISSQNQKRRNSSNKKGSATAALLLPVAQQFFEQMLPLPTATQGAQWIGRYWNDADHFSIIQPGEVIALLDLVAPADRSWHDGLSAFGH